MDTFYKGEILYSMSMQCWASIKKLHYTSETVQNKNVSIAFNALEKRVLTYIIYYIAAMLKNVGVFRC